MKLDVEDLQKKLEMAELMIQQVRAEDSDDTATLPSERGGKTELLALKEGMTSHQDILLGKSFQQGLRGAEKFVFFKVLEL